MEKFRFVKVLGELRDSGVPVKRITTYPHKLIRKHMRHKETEIDLQFVIWHIKKNCATVRSYSSSYLDKEQFLKKTIREVVTTLGNIT